MDINEILEKLPELKKFDVEQVKRGMEVEAEHKDVTQGDPILTARIVLAHLKERPDYYELLDKYVEDESEETEKKNAKQKPKIFYARHIEKGVARYSDEDIFVDDDFLKKIAPTFEGCPVYVLHQEVDLNKLQEEADGYIAENFYNPIDGWYWTKFIIVSDKGQEAINKKWRVSNAYVITQTEGKGVWHNIEYNRKVTDGYYTHLAIVPDPRYEDSVILTPEEFKEYCDNKKTELKNSKTKNNGGNIVNFFRRKQVKEEIKEIKNESDLEGAMIEVDGKEIALKDMVEAVKKHNAEAAEEEKKKKEAEEKNKLNADSEIDVDGKKMKVSSLIEEYKKSCKKNADDAAAKDKEEKEEKEKQNQKRIEDQKKIDELKNAAGNDDKVIPIETAKTKEDRGQSRYGSSK